MTSKDTSLAGYRMALALALMLILASAVNGQTDSLDEAPAVLSRKSKGTIRIAFGSCYKNHKYTDKYKSVFGRIGETKPDVFIWTGDAIYADRPVFGVKVRFDDQTIEKLFNDLKTNEFYRNFS